MDDDAYDLGMPEDEDATYSALGGGALPSGLGAYQAAYNQQAEGIRAMYAQAERMLRDREARREKGSQSERLLAMAAALGQPTRTGSLGETLGNVNAALLGGMKSQRERKEALEDMLFQQRMASNNLLAKLHGQYFTAATRQPKGTWSESMGQFVSPSKPVPTKNVVQTGQYRLTQYTDGTFRMMNADGTQSVYTPEGVKIKDIPVGGE